MTEQRIYLADGVTSVPTKAVEALNELDQKWPGATFPGARPAIAAAVIAALDFDDERTMFLTEVAGEHELTALQLQTALDAATAIFLQRVDDMRQANRRHH